MAKAEILPDDDVLLHLTEEEARDLTWLLRSHTSSGCMPSLCDALRKIPRSPDSDPFIGGPHYVRRRAIHG